MVEDDPQSNPLYVNIIILVLHICMCGEEFESTPNPSKVHNDHTNHLLLRGTMEITLKKHKKSRWKRVFPQCFPPLQGAP